MTAPRPPSGPLWLHEIKHDGIRVIAQRQGDRVKLYSRHGNDMTKRFPLIVEAMMRLRASSCVIDGEAVLCGDDGIPSFDLLRHKLHEGRGFLYAFDLIELDGEDLQGATLEQRKISLWRVLKNATGGTASPGLLINDWIEGAESDGATVFQHACSLSLEVSYQSARARATIRTAALLAQVEESRQPGGAPGDRGGMGPATIMKKEIGAVRDQIQATTTLAPHVNSHGTTTQGHHQTSPNTTQLDNFGTRGNVNPYTDAVGTRGARY